MNTSVETPGVAIIRAEESQGQSDIVTNEALPITCTNCSREQLEKLGFVFKDQIDNLFVKVVLPDGWTKVATDHSMWSHLLDEQERRRGIIFYKASLYDRRANWFLEE